MLASWTKWWSSWIWPAQQQQNLTLSSSVIVNASDATATVIGLTSHIATTSSTTIPTFLHVVHNSTSTIPTHFHPSASILSTTADTTLDYLSTSTSTTITTATSATTISSTTTTDGNSTSSLWSTLLSNYTSWLPSSYNNASFPPYVDIGRLAENLTKLSGSEAFFETFFIGRNESSSSSSAFNSSSSASASSSGAYFETADFSEDELLFRLIWSNASYSPDWAITLRPNDTNGTVDGGFGDDGDMVSWNLVATIATALVLGFIIMATVIGE